MAIVDIRALHDLLQQAMEHISSQYRESSAAAPPNGACPLDPRTYQELRGARLDTALGPPLSQATPTRDPNYRTLARVPDGDQSRRQMEGAPIPPIQPEAPTLSYPEWWHSTADVVPLLLRGMYGRKGGGDGAYRRCLEAAEGSVEDWNDFCRFLDRRQNLTAGGESQNRACWSKAYGSKADKKSWCDNQFGPESNGG